MYINFEIDKKLYKKVERYSNFFCMKKSHFMQLLVTMGVNDFSNQHDITIMSTKIGSKEKTIYKEISRKLYPYLKEGDGAVFSDEIEKVIDKLNDILVEVKKEEVNFNRSDVICSLIRYEINNRLNYLEDVRIWNNNLLEDKLSKRQQKINMEIPLVFYEALDEKARLYNISVSDYIKVLIEQDFDERYR